MIVFELGGVPVRLEAALEFNQTYRRLGGYSIQRALNGAAEKHVQWARLGTTLSGAGNLPAGLAGLDYNQSMVLKCGAPRGITAPSNVIALPAARRADLLPKGFALFEDRWIATPVAMAGNTATLTIVAGANAYEVFYYPQMAVFAEITDEGDMREARYRWQIEAEEV